MEESERYEFQDERRRSLNRQSSYSHLFQ